jgi:tripartite-type tricarboxylate transporter receptor subunit TctC
MLLRRQLLRYAESSIVGGALPRAAFALDYPTRAARVVVPFLPGGGADITARLIAQWLSDALPLGGSPDEFRKLIADETEKWGKVIKFAGISDG